MLYVSTAITLSDRAYVILIVLLIHRHADVVISGSEQDFNSGYMALCKYILLLLLLLLRW